MTGPAGPRWEHHGNASLDVTIKNGRQVEVYGTGLTSEQAIEGVCAFLPVVELSRYQTLEAALNEAADDLGKAANQFASIRASQRAGHAPEVRSNPGVFERKEARARAALASAGAGGGQGDG